MHSAHHERNEADYIRRLRHQSGRQGYLLRKGRTPAIYATSLVEGAVNGWATAAGRKAWERRRA